MKISFYKNNQRFGFSPGEGSQSCEGLIFEPRRVYVAPKLGKRLKSLQDITEGVLDDIQNTEKKLRIIPLSKRYCYHLSSCLEAWMNGEKFDKVMQYVNADEGELIRYFRMAIQILREIPETPVSSEVKQNAKKALRLINRDIIDAEKQLRR